MSPLPELLYIIHIKSTFVLKDKRLLEENFVVREFYFNQSTPLSFFYSFIRQMLFLLRYQRKNKVIVSQFAGYHTLLPAITAKISNIPFIIIAAGTESYSFPSINYGNFRKPLLGWFTKISFRLSSLILPVHSSLIYSKQEYYNRDYPYQGIKYFVQGLKTPYKYIPYGYDVNKWKKNNKEKVPKTFATIAGGCEKRAVFLRKGIDLIFEVAPYFPDCMFMVIGGKLDTTDKEIPQNVLIFPFLSQDELIDILSSSAFYLQLSIAEGFPNALCEAMLCECIPVGSDVAGIPEIIGETGYIVQKREINNVRAALKSAIEEFDVSKGQIARTRITTLFTEERRTTAFKEAIEGILN